MSHSLKPYRIGAMYLARAIEPTDKLAEEARAALDGVEFDTLVGTGLSGAIVVPRVAEALGVHWLIVRKPNDGSHSVHKAEGTLGKRWVFMDDLMATGNTQRRVLETMRALAEEGTGYPSYHDIHTEYVGTYIYGDGGMHAPRFSPADPPVRDMIRPELADAIEARVDAGLSDIFIKGVSA